MRKRQKEPRWLQRVHMFAWNTSYVSRPVATEGEPVWFQLNHNDWGLL